MSDSKFRLKIKKLIDIRQRITKIEKIFNESNLNNNLHNLESTIHDLETTVELLLEFKSFDAYKIINQLILVFKRVKSQELKLNESLTDITNHLFKVSCQQILLIQNIIENKIITDESLSILNDEMNKKNLIQTFFKKELKLPTLIDLNHSEEMIQANSIKEEVSNNQLLSANIAVDINKFEKMQKHYKSIINLKNKLITSKDLDTVELRQSINKFAAQFEQSNLIPVNRYLDNAVQSFDNYIKASGKHTKIKSFWGKSKFQYFKVEPLERYLSTLLELIADYQLVNQSDEHFIDIKSVQKNSFLTIEITVDAKVVNLMNLLKEANDHRYNVLTQLENSLNLKKNIITSKDISTTYQINIPLHHNIYTAHLALNDNEKYFILEDEIVKFIQFKPNDIVKEKGEHFYQADGKLVRISNKFKNMINISSKIGVIILTRGEKQVLLFDEILKKEQIAFENHYSNDSFYPSRGTCCYANEKINVLDAGELSSNIIRLETTQQDKVG